MPFAVAYVRGHLRLDASLSDEEVLARGAELKLHRFKRGELARVKPVVGALRGFGAASVVDLGSGRGAFVWPVLDAIDYLSLVAVDLLDYRAQLFVDAHRGGLARVTGVRADITRLPFADRSVDAVTALEVFEHLHDPGPERAIRETLRVARTVVIATVPSHEDDNPEHVQLFTGARLEKLFLANGARRVTIDHVLNHIVVVATP